MHYNSGGSYRTWSNIIPKRGKSVKLKQKYFDFTKTFSSIKILHLAVHKKLKTIAFLQEKKFERSDKTFSSAFSHFYGKCLKQISPVKKKRKKFAILQRRDQPIYRF
jgi:hypothetical protein